MKTDLAQQTSTETSTTGAKTIGLRQTIRQLGSDPTVAVSISLIVLLTGLLLTLTPAGFDRIATDALAEDLDTASASDRHIEVRRVSRLGVRVSEPFALVRSAQADFRETQMPASIQELVAGELTVIDSPQFNTNHFPGAERQTFPTFLTLRHQLDIDDQVQLIEGKMPESVPPVLMREGPDCPVVELGQSPLAPPVETLEDLNGDGLIECEDAEFPRYELAVTPETLQSLELGVGDRLLVTPDASDPQLFSVPRIRLNYVLVVEISGVFEAIDDEAEYWFDDSALLRPRMRSNADFTDIFATALVSPYVHTELRRDLGLALWDYRFRYLLETDQLTPGEVPQLAADLRGMETNFDPIQSALSSGFTLRTGLTELLLNYLDRKDTAFALLRLAVSGVFVVALTVVLLLFALSSTRHSRHTVLLRNRGSGRAQLINSKLLQGVVLSAPAGVLAYIAVTSWLPADAAGTVISLSGLIATTAAVSVLAALPWIRRDLGSLQRDQATVRRASAQRLVIEGMVVALAVLSITLLRRRGFDEDNQLDLLALAGPALLGIAVSLVTLRIYPALIAPLAWIGRRRKGLVTFVGFKRVQQMAPASRLPLTVILLAAAMAIFTSVVQSSIAAGQQESTWHRAGADHRITSFNPGQALPAIDLSTIGRIEARAEAFGLTDVRVHDGSPEAPRLVDILAMEPRDYRTVVAGTPAEVSFSPKFLAAADTQGLGGSESPIPAIAVGQIPNHEPVAKGMDFSISINGTLVAIEVDEVRPNFPSVEQGGITMILPHGSLERFLETELRPSHLYLRAPGVIHPMLVDLVGGEVPVAVLTSQQALLDEIRTDSFVSAADTGLKVSLGLSLLFGVVAAVSSLALMADVRRRDFGRLRTMGLTRRQGTQLTIIEQIPPLVMAVGVGSLLGAGIAVLLQPSVNVGAFTGPGFNNQLTIDAPSIFFTALVVTAVTSSAVVIFAWLDRRQNLSRLLRIGDD